MLLSTVTNNENLQKSNIITGHGKGAPHDRNAVVTDMMKELNDVERAKQPNGTILTGEQQSIFSVKTNTALTPLPEQPDADILAKQVASVTRDGKKRIKPVLLGT